MENSKKNVLSIIQYEAGVIDVIVKNVVKALSEQRYTVDTIRVGKGVLRNCNVIKLHFNPDSDLFKLLEPCYETDLGQKIRKDLYERFKIGTDSVILHSGGFYIDIITGGRE